MSKLPRATIAVGAIPALIKKLERRLSDLDDVRAHQVKDHVGDGKRIAASINATMDDVFGVGTADAADFRVDSKWFWSFYSEHQHQKLEDFSKGLERATALVNDAIKRLVEKAADGEESDEAKTLKAYEGLSLHPEIARAASGLYRDGHYASAVLDAVKALNAFVRLRSGVDDRDGTELMEFVFSVKSPVLAFNDLKDDSDRNEQKGFMMMFSGAVAGLRNPRAHTLVKDDPERALEFIAYVSLLAKLADGAKRMGP
ncbi:MULTISPECIES: TIGR02391 family protein [unclassified Bradyrhizobium]|uniref:TIGR02391 family protein n=1 Tax=unclassified Bradyrhizobium TaxID=2631580 RepID=UPI0028E83459|nr:MULTISPECIES: TIGR02391 family protein [unclassified Bradyrhizobium]